MTDSLSYTTVNIAPTRIGPLSYFAIGQVRALSRAGHDHAAIGRVMRISADDVTLALDPDTAMKSE